MSTEQTCVIIKPDAVKRGLVGEIISRIERKLLTFTIIKQERLTSQFVDELYQEHIHAGFYEHHKEFMLSGDVILIIVVGEEAVYKMRRIVGNAMDPLVGTVRGDFAESTTYNLVHASENLDAACREIKLIGEIK